MAYFKRNPMDSAERDDARFEVFRIRLLHALAGSKLEVPVEWQYPYVREEIPIDQLYRNLKEFDAQLIPKPGGGYRRVA